MLLGQFDGMISGKARLAFPKKFREVLGEKLIITQGFEQSLIVVSEEGWQALLEGSDGHPFTNAASRETQRFLLGGAAFVQLDDKGRFVLPDYLKKYAEIGEEVVFIGMHRFVEVWDKKRWEAYNSNLAKNISVVAERLNQPETERRKGNE